MEVHGVVLEQFDSMLPHTLPPDLYVRSRTAQTDGLHTQPTASTPNPQPLPHPTTTSTPNPQPQHSTFNPPPQHSTPNHHLHTQPSSSPQRNFMNELMAAYAMPHHTTFSALTLAALEDSGWYAVNYSQASV